MEKQNTGKFITFEGGEGSGKSTQVRAIVDFLRQKQIDVVHTREPGGSEGAELLRALLVNGEANRWSPLSEALMMYAARADHVEKLIRPALLCGKWVICDRFSDSTRAYQGAGGGIERTLIETLDKVAVGATQPDLTFVLDIPVKIGLHRAERRGSDEQRFESKDISFHQRLRQAFIDQAQSNPDRYVLIDANQTIDEISQAVLQNLIYHFPHLKSA